MSEKDIEAAETEEMISKRIHRILLVGSERFETRHRCKDGKIVEIEASVNYNEAGGGKFFVFMRDITERNQVQTGYKESQARLSEAQSVAHIGNWEWKVKTNELIWSAENYKIFGLSPTISPSFELFLNTVHPDDLEFVKKSIEEALHGEQYDIDIRIIKADGIDGYIHATGIVNFDEEGTPTRMFGTVQDITERKLAEYELSKFKLGIERSNEAIFITDIDGTIIYINPAFENLYGFDRKEALGKKPSILKSGLLPSGAYEKFWDTLLSKNVVSGELIHKTKDGRLLNIQGSANPIMNGKGDIFGFLAIQRDITEHKRIVEMVKESEERFHSITQSANDAIITANSKGNIIFWNNSARNLFGYRDEEVMGKHLTFLMPERYRDTHLKGMEQLLATGMPNVIGKRVELLGLRKDGSEVIIELSLSTWKTGDKLFYSGILRDITERKLADETIRKSLEEKEVLIREIHHRVKNNMQIVSSLLRLQSQNIEDKKYKDMFIESQNRVYSMALIHEKLYQSESLAQINFKDYIDGIVTNIIEYHRIKSNIRIDSNIENISMKIDYAVPVGLIINELLTNSFKYAFPDGRQGKIQISLKSDNNNIQLSISDDGIGIPKELDIRNTKSLGLYLVTALAEGQLHGKIILNRERGTEFQISFVGAK